MMDGATKFLLWLLAFILVFVSLFAFVFPAVQRHQEIRLNEQEIERAQREKEVYEARLAYETYLAEHPPAPTPSPEPMTEEEFQQAQLAELQKQTAAARAAAKAAQEAEYQLDLQRRLNAIWRWSVTDWG